MTSSMYDNPRLWRRADCFLVPELLVVADGYQSLVRYLVVVADVARARNV